MLDRLFAILAPHYCYGCGKCGQLLCQGCKKYINKHAFSGCVLCGGRPKSANLCSRHRQLYRNLYCGYYRTDVVAKLIDDLKFHRVKAVAKTLAELLDDTLPDISDDTVVTYIPTTPRHIRRRGYDHMKLIANEFAKLRQLPCRNTLLRQNNTTQHFAKNAAQRRQQAKNFFTPAKNIDKSKKHLIIDDIFTTGSTVKEAANCLARAGVENIEVAIIARQQNF